eukprot:CAMPEP_0185834930 /NCGR_PEP_ID=MMETSP1353-20130828/6624_1 /TAXON_ID=1077150 /ORGANISM="Erythrolobus australicus, Strain CCMP3124" /LENGTH=253 /DNA_ID=CAMNT_0028533463 /DNA_START=194 /DNA_END=956 /DNA_ORIENTATION=-
MHVKVCRDGQCWSIRVMLILALLLATCATNCAAAPLRWPLSVESEVEQRAQEWIQQNTQAHEQQSEGMFSALAHRVSALVDFLSFKKEIRDHDLQLTEPLKHNEGESAQLHAQVTAESSEKLHDVASAALPSESESPAQIEQRDATEPKQEVAVKASQSLKGGASDSTLNVQRLDYALEVTDDLQMMLSLLDKAVKKLQGSLKGTRQDLARDTEQTGPANIIRRFFKREFEEVKPSSKKLRACAAVEAYKVAV